ncbi:MAG: ATP-binding protein [Thermodesulfobacteriota bacterium]|nr:ATP-binding protein [Thermodesulfobacteriota bacterium]
MEHSLGSFPVTALLGPRQCGKSTLAAKALLGRDDMIFLDLERPSDLRKLDDPEFFFHTQQDKLICIDEVQRKPELFQVLRVVVDENRRPGRFLILGSASQELIRQSSESLAGRIHYLELSPFGYDELLAHDRTLYADPLMAWVRGGFPDSVLAGSELTSFQWREDFIRTFLERDLPQFGFSIPAVNMRRFWTMLAHFHGQTLNASKIAQSLGVSGPTVRRYLDIMEQTYMVRVLPPFFANIKKRLVKAPKVYLRDAGILHSLLDIENADQLLGHPVLGASWEGWCMEQILGVLPGWRACFYRTSSGEEIDLVVERGRRRFAFEFKASMSPKVSRGFAGSLEILQPEQTWVVAPVKDSYPLRPGVQVVNMSRMLEELKPLVGC